MGLLKVMAKTICEHSVNRFLNCSAARPCNMSVPPSTLQGIRNLLSGLILKYYFFTPKWPLPMIILQFSEKGLCLSTPRTLTRWNCSASSTLLWASSGAPLTGCPYSNLDNTFQKLYLLKKISFKHFGKVIFVKCFRL